MKCCGEVPHAFMRTLNQSCECMARGPLWEPALQWLQSVAEATSQHRFFLKPDVFAVLLTPKDTCPNEVD